MKEREKKKKKKTLTTSSNSTEGEIGGLSVPVKEPIPFKGSLLLSLPDVNGETSCQNNKKRKTHLEVITQMKEKSKAAS